MPREAASMVEVSIDKVGIDVGTGQAVVLLASAEENMLLPIWIGPVEANAIAIGLEGVKPPRPITSDLLKEILDRFKAEMVMAFIHDLRDSTFYAKVVLKVDDGTMEIDSRPSDAIALAVRAKAPIYVSRRVILEAGISGTGPMLH